MNKTKILTAVLLIAFLLPPIFAQGTGQPARSSAQSQVDPGEAVRLLQGGAPTDDASKAVVTTYLKNFFARWMDPNNAAELGNYRRQIQLVINSVSNPQGKDYLLVQFAGYLSNFANKKELNLYPAGRYNAVLALGELEADAGTPYPQALGILYRIYEDKGDGQDMAREAVRLGALQGIRRHVILGIANAQARDERIAPLLMKIVADTPYQKDDSGTADDDIIVLSVNPNAENTSEPQRTVEVQNWFRNTAIETLGHMSNASVPAQNAIIDTLLTRIQDDMELASIRYQCAYSLSRFSRAIENSPDLLKRTTQALLSLGVTVHDDGIQTMIEEQSTTQTVSTTGSMGGSMGGGIGDGMMAGPSMGGSSMGGGSTMGQTQADQVNNSLIQIKDGFSSIRACIQGPDYRSGGLVNSDSVKNTPYHEVLLGLDKIITECVKFLDEGDPEAKKLAAAATAQADRGMGGMGKIPGVGTDGTTAAAKVKNQPKVSMKEIEDRLKIVKKSVEELQNVMRRLDAGLTTAAQ